MDYTDYNSVAEIYDLYAYVSYDHDFFLNIISPGMKVLELTSGTGRLSIPLINAKAELTCVDISRAMLDVLERKLKNLNLKARVVCSDVQHLKYDREFELAIFPFQSFMELIGSDKQLNCLRSVYDALVWRGTFYCTMHNPEIRRMSVDGVVRKVGTFKHGTDTFVVSGVESGGDPVVSRTQYIEHFNFAGELIKRITQPMEFELIEENSFRKNATEVGFTIKALYGGYGAEKFQSEKSPVMIWKLVK